MEKNTQFWHDTVGRDISNEFDTMTAFVTHRKLTEILKSINDSGELDNIREITLEKTTKILEIHFKYLPGEGFTGIDGVSYPKKSREGIFIEGNKILINECKSENPNNLCRMLDYALNIGNQSNLEKLYDCGMSIDQTDFEGRTALQLMSYKGKIEIVKMLISRCANINKIFMYHDNMPKTALDAAIEGKRKDIEELLLSIGAKKGSEITNNT